MPTKIEVMNSLIADDNVLLHLDPRREDVVGVPAHLRNSPHVALEYGLNMPIPIRDLKIDEQGVAATLSFQRAPTYTFVPWAAVYAITIANDPQQRGMLWQDDIPSEMRAGNQSAPSTTPSTKSPPAGKRPNHLRLVKP
jgi:hypothetical protein